jgi:hypothetical protein
MEKELGFRKAYKMTGTPGYAGGPGDKTVDPGTSGSHRDNNWKKGAAQSEGHQRLPVLIWGGSSKSLA